MMNSYGAITTEELIPPNGFELIGPARTLAGFSRNSLGAQCLQIAQPAGSDAVSCYPAHYLADSRTTSSSKTIGR